MTVTAWGTLRISARMDEEILSRERGDGCGSSGLRIEVLDVLGAIKLTSIELLTRSELLELAVVIILLVAFE